jgi:plastocyanin
MRKLLVTIAALCAVAVGIVPALAQAANVAITKIALVPTTLTIEQNESVTWTNTDTSDHQLVSAKANLASPVLKPGQSFTFPFTKDGKFTIKDALSKLSGTVTVKKETAAAAAARSVTVRASTVQAVFNTSVTLSGVISSHAAGEKVTVRSQPHGANGFRKLTDVTTGQGGTWSYTVKPTIRTVYRPEWGNGVNTVTVGVRPLVTLRILSGNRFSTKVVAARSFAGKFVQLQRRSSFGQWVTVKRMKLNANSAAVMRAKLPSGNSRLRFAFSVNQAGPGYLGGFSRIVVFHH